MNRLLNKYNQHFSDPTFSVSKDDLYRTIYFSLEDSNQKISPLLLMQTADIYGQVSDNILEAAYAMELLGHFWNSHRDVILQYRDASYSSALTRRFGANETIIGGDILMVLAYQYLAKTRTEKTEKAISLFNEKLVDHLEGFHDENENVFQNVHEYLLVFEKNMGALWGLSAQLGGFLTNADAEDQTHLYNFGKYLGCYVHLKKEYDHIVQFSTISKEQNPYLVTVFQQLDSVIMDAGSTVLSPEKQSELMKTTSEQINTYFELTQDALKNLSCKHENKKKLEQLIYFTENQNMVA